MINHNLHYYKHWKKQLPMK